MKNVRYIFCALALLMCTTAAATKVTDSDQFTATFDGAKKVTFKVLVRCADEGGGGDNLMYQVDMANTFKEGQLSTTDINHTTHFYCVVYNNNVKETTRNLLYSHKWFPKQEPAGWLLPSRWALRIIRVCSKSPMPSKAKCMKPSGGEITLMFSSGNRNPTDLPSTLSNGVLLIMKIKLWRENGKCPIALSGRR